MAKTRKIADAAEVERLRTVIEASAVTVVCRLQEILRTQSPLEALTSIRFGATGCDPLDADRTLNFVEQLNQTFTYLATLDAVEWLLKRHPERVPFVLNLGTAAGPDIASEDGKLAAEVFAAVTPRNNKKLERDIAKVANTPAAHRYVFFACSPGATVPNTGAASRSVTLVPLGMDCQGDSTTRSNG